MKKTNWILALALLSPVLAFAGFGGMGNVEGDNGGGPISPGFILFAVLFFGGLFYYFYKSDDEVAAFGKLAIAVFGFLVLSALVKCA